MLDFQLGASYRALDWLSVELFLPIKSTLIEANFNDASGQAIDGFSSIHHRTETLYGIGDLLMGTRMTAIIPDASLRLMLEFQLGVTVPTGNIEPDPFELGMKGEEHQHLFFGSGTFNPVFGLTTRYSFTDFSLGAWVNAALPVYRNSMGYKAPSTVQAGLNGMVPLGTDSVTLVAEAGFFYEWPATWGDKPAENSGRMDLLASLGVHWRVTDELSASVSAKIPVYTEAEGGQLDIPYIAQIAVQGHFQLLDTPTVP